MDYARRSQIERLMREKEYAKALTPLLDSINSMTIERISYGNEDFVWAISQRCICFLKLGYFSEAYNQARKLIKKRPTLSVGYLRKSEVELEVGLTDQAVSTLSLWQHRRPSGDDGDGTAEVLQQLRVARERHRLAVNKKKNFERCATYVGWLLGGLLGAWLCSFEFSWVVVYVALGALFGYLFKHGAIAMDRMHESQRRSILVDAVGSEEEH